MVKLIFFNTTFVIKENLPCRCNRQDVIIINGQFFSFIDRSHRGNALDHSESWMIEIIKLTVWTE